MQLFFSIINDHKLLAVSSHNSDPMELRWRLGKCLVFLFDTLFHLI